MTTSTKTTEIEAIRLIDPIFDAKGNQLADKGDWILTDGSEQYYMSHEEFSKEYTKKIIEDYKSTKPLPIYPTHPGPCVPRWGWGDV